MSVAQAAFAIIIAIAFVFYFFLSLFLSAFCDNRPQLCFFVLSFLTALPLFGFPFYRRL